MKTVFQPKGFNIREGLSAHVRWWLATANDSSNARIVNNDGDRNYNNPDKRNGAVRPDLLLKSEPSNHALKIAWLGTKARSKKVAKEGSIKWCNLVPKSKGIPLLTNRLKCGGRTLALMPYGGGLSPFSVRLESAD